MRRSLAALLGMLVVVTTLVAPAHAAGVAPKGSIGIDVSYPQCGAVGPSMTGAFGVVGVTGGSAWTANPCLAAEAARFPAALHLYVNTGWYAASTHVSATTPKACAAGDLVCRAYNYGYGAGRDALAVAAAAGVHGATWWLDVENGNTWSTVTAQNRASLQGEYDALRKGGVAVVGAYSTTAQWNAITGSWLNGWPGWGATVLTSASQAATYRTGHRFTGGQTWMIQFRGATYDMDVTCAVASVPSAPRSVVASPRSRSAVVSWTAPVTNGGSAVTGYRVTATPGGRTCATTTARSCTVTGLADRTAYRFTVRAVNIAGVGPSSAASAAVVSGAPAAARSLAVVFPAAHVVRATWSTPVSRGSGAITAYQVRWTADAGLHWTSWASTRLTRTASRSGLVKGRTYTVQVRALNAYGAGPVAGRRFVQGR